MVKTLGFMLVSHVYVMYVCGLHQGDLPLGALDKARSLSRCPSDGRSLMARGSYRPGKALAFHSA